MARNIFFRVGCILLSAFGSLLFSQGVDSPPIYPFYEVPNPLSGNNPVYHLIPRAVPLPGKSFHDLCFKTTITRTTKTLGLRHEYSRFDPFNVNQSMIVLLDLPTGDWKIYKTKRKYYDQSGNFVRTLNNQAEPRWDPKDPSLIWGLRDFSIIRINVKTGRVTVIKNFSKDQTIGPIIKAEPDLYRITTKDEGESSLDKRFWALCLQGSKDDYRLRYIFTWDLKLNKILGLHKLSSAEAQLIDWVGMSPLGKWVLIGGDAGEDQTWAGLNMVDKKFSSFHRLASATAHSDVGLDTQGNEIIVMQNSRTDYIDFIPISLHARPVDDVGDYKNNSVKPIVRLYYNSNSPIGLNSGVHISGNHGGYCVISTNTEPGVPEQNWLDRTITLVRLDRKKFRVFYLAKVYNTTGSYWEETQATITNDGSKVVWASNWGQNVGKDKVFLVRLDMPPNWEKQFNFQKSDQIFRAKSYN